MSKLPISVCIIAKNEEKYIEGCLQHLKPFGFEIVVTDTGSTDRTKEIAEQYADKVLDFEWIDDFSAARNFCAEHAENNWILALDCDEYLQTFNYQQVRIESKKHLRSVGRFPLTNIVKGMDGSEGYNYDEVVRFYNKKYFFWIHEVHEQLASIENPDLTKYTYFEMQMEVIHYGYNISGEEMVQKQIRNLELLGKTLEKKPTDSYSWFQIGQSQFVIGSYDRAASAYEMSLKYLPDCDRFYAEIAVESLARTYIVLGRAQDGVSLMLQYADKFKTAKFVYMLACTYFESEQPLQALVNYIKATAMPDRDTLGESLLHCYTNIISIYKMMGEEEMANMYTGLLEKSKAERERVLNS